MFTKIIIQVLVLILLSMSVFAQRTITLSELKNRKSNSKKSTNNKSKSASSIKLSKLEGDVFAEVNKARRNPKTYINYLLSYKKLVRNKTLYRPNRLPYKLVEGKSAISNAISVLKKKKSKVPFAFSNGLTKAAQKQLKDLQQDNTIGHTGKDGSNLKTRLLKIGTGAKKASENITHRNRNAREVVLTMIIDDGVASRTHRNNILSNQFNYLGIACGDDKEKNMICVLVFADTFSIGGTKKPQIKSF